MPDQDSTVSGLWCPVCLTPIEAEARCPACGLLQQGETPARLRVIVARLHELSVEQMALVSEGAELGDERTRLLASLRGEPAPGLPPIAEPAPATGPGFADWRPERVRDTLLWLGAALLALSAITFAIVAWARLDPAGRAGLLLGATALAGGAAIGLCRRLRATSEALTGLTLALGLVDWYVLRRAGLGDGLDVATWWAIGTALLAGIALTGAWRLQLRSARLGAALLGLTSAGFALGATVGSLWTAAVGCAVVACVVFVGSITAERRLRWADVGVLLAAGSVAFEVAAFLFAITAVADIATFADAVGPALAILALGGAPALVVATAGDRRRGFSAYDPFVTLTAAAVISAPLVLLSADVEPPWLAVIAAGLGVVALALGRLAGRALRVGVAVAGTGAIGIAVVGLSSQIALAIVGPLGWLSDPWSGSLGLSTQDHFGPTDSQVLTDGWAVVAVLVAVVAAAVVALSRPGWRAPLVPALPAAIVAGIALPAALAVALPAAGATIGTALVVELVAAIGLTAFAVWFESRRAALVPWFLVGVAVLVAPVTGWAAVDSGATVAVLGVIVVVAGFAGALTTTKLSRVALITLAAIAALAEAGAAVGAVTDHAGPAGFAIALMGGGILVLGALGRRSAPEGVPLEVVGIAGLAAGALLSSESLAWLAAALTVAVPALGCAALRPDRAVGYVRATAVVAVGAIWAWLGAADVSVLEAYTLPAAAVLLGAGVLRRRANPEVGSWGAYGAGLVLGIGPSLLVALDRSGTARPLGVIAAAVVCVLVGSRRELRAPLTIGAVALIALAIDDLGPVAAAVPRWVALGVIGLLMLWLGASAERRLNQLRRWRLALKRLA